MKKKITAVLVALLLAGCDSPISTEQEIYNNGDNIIEYRYQYEFKNDLKEDVSIVFCREFSVSKRISDSYGIGYHVDSTLSTFDTLLIPVDSIISIGSDNDTLIVSPQYMLNIFDGRFRVIEYGNNIRKLSNEEY